MKKKYIIINIFSLIAITLSIASLIYNIVKGYNLLPIIIAFCCAILVLLFNNISKPNKK